MRVLNWGPSTDLYMCNFVALYYCSLCRVQVAVLNSLSKLTAISAQSFYRGGFRTPKLKGNLQDSSENVERYGTKIALKTAAGLHVRDLRSQPRERKIAVDLLKVLMGMIRFKQDSDAILKTVIVFKKDNGVLLKKPALLFLFAMYFTEIDTSLLIEPQRTFNSLTWSPTRCFSIRYCRFCPSMFLYLMTMIPCDWIAKRQVLDCVASNQDENTACLRAVNDSAVLYQVSIKANHVRRVLRHFGQRSFARRDPKSLNFVPRLLRNVLGNWNSPESLLTTNRWPKSLRTLGTRLKVPGNSGYKIGK